MKVSLVKEQFARTDAVMLVSATQKLNLLVKQTVFIQLHGMLTKKLVVFVILDDEDLIARLLNAHLAQMFSAGLEMKLVVIAQVVVFVIILRVSAIVSMVITVPNANIKLSWVRPNIAAHYFTPPY